MNNRLIRLADYLDSLGFHKEASYVDSMIVSSADDEPEEGDGRVDIEPGELRDLADMMDSNQGVAFEAPNFESSTKMSDDWADGFHSNMESTWNRIQKIRERRGLPTKEYVRPEGGQYLRRYLKDDPELALEQVKGIMPELLKEQDKRNDRWREITSPDWEPNDKYMDRPEENLSIEDPEERLMDFLARLNPHWSSDISTYLYQNNMQRPSKLMKRYQEWARENTGEEISDEEIVRRWPDMNSDQKKPWRSPRHTEEYWSWGVWARNLRKKLKEDTSEALEQIHDVALALSEEDSRGHEAGMYDIPEEDFDIDDPERRLMGVLSKLSDTSISRISAYLRSNHLDRPSKVMRRYQQWAKETTGEEISDEEIVRRFRTEEIPYEERTPWRTR